MYDVRISDSLYVQATEAAKAHHVSVDRYVEEALQVQLNADAPVRLNDEQAIAIAEAEAEIDAGRFFTAEEIRHYFNKKAACPPTGQP